MSELTDCDRAAYAAVDDALRAYPLASVPPTLAPAVMARVRVLSPTPRFRLEWIDYALSLFAAGMVGLGLVIWQSISPQLVLDMQTLLSDLLLYPDLRMWIMALLGGVALAACALALAALVFAQTSASHLQWIRSH